MGIIDFVFNAIIGFLNFVKGLVKTIIRGILNFAKDVVNYFKNLNLTQGKDIPFIAQGEQFKELIKNAPNKNVGIFEGVYNEVEDEITEAQYIGADQVDQQTRNVLGDEQLVTLS